MPTRRRFPPELSRSAWDRLALLVAAIVVVLSLLPAAEVRGAPGGDKLHHLLAYGVLGVLAVVSCRSAGAWSIRAGLVLTLGLAIEIVQPWFGRTFEWPDVASNAAGLAIGAGAVLAARLVRGEG